MKVFAIILFFAASASALFIADKNKPVSKKEVLDKINKVQKKYDLIEQKNILLEHKTDSLIEAQKVLQLISKRR